MVEGVGMRGGVEEGRGRRLRVLCFSIGPEAEPSSRYRVFQLREPLRRQGIDLEVRPLAGERYFEMGYGLRPVPAALRGPWVAGHFLARLPRRARDLAAARRYDLLLVQKETFPFGLEGMVSRLGLRVVYDFDDAVHIPSSLPEGQGRTLRRVAETVMRRERALPALLQQCSLVMAGNRLLAGWAARFASRVAIVPTVVDADAHAPVPRRRGPLTVGWFGAPAGVEHLAPLRPVLQGLARRFDFRLRVHGVDSFDCPGVRVEAVAWKRYRSAAAEAEDLRHFDVGIMPLPDTPRAAGKCALKAIQYMACGIPVVASPVGIAGEVIGDAGLGARTPREWGDALAALLADADLRARLGQAGRERVDRHYSLRAVTPRIAALLRQAAAAPRPRWSRPPATPPPRPRSEHAGR